MLQRFPASQWTFAQAAHLLNRAGFGGSPVEIAQLQALGLAKAVEKMVKGDEDDDLFPPPALTQPAEVHAQYLQVKAITDEQKKKEMRNQFQREQGEQIRQLRAWWLNRMRYTSHPLREKLTLFWHGHFATGTEKVRSAYMLWQQNETLRANALGNFREFAKQISKDPAMMRYLDTVQSNRRKPNENFARELMELFMLGEGVCYTEEDIKESARAFTGYRVNPQEMAFQFLSKQFDPEEKQFMGRRGPFTGDDIIDIILERKECSEFIARKLWIYFGSENPSPETVSALAAHFRESGFDIRSVVREIFLSSEFYSPAVVRRQVKSPVQWIVQTSRVLETTLPPAPAVEAAMSQLGQVLFAPPNVKGWDGGRAWISSSTLLFRYNLAGYIVSGQQAMLDGFKKDARAVPLALEKIAPANVRSDHGRLCDLVITRLLNAPVSSREREKFLAFLHEQGGQIGDSSLRDFLHLVMSTPDYQLT